MKKIILSLLVILLTFVLASCKPSVETEDPDDNYIPTNPAPDGLLEEVETFLVNSYVIVDNSAVTPELLEIVLTDAITLSETLETELIDSPNEELQSALDSVLLLIEDIYAKLFELMGYDVRLLNIIEAQKEAIIGDIIIEVEPLNFNSGGPGFLGQMLSAPRINFSSEVKPFDGNEEWATTQARYYEMLAEIVEQGYGQGEVVNINEFTFQQPLDYYGINEMLNEEYFIEINLDGNETLFSRVLTYDDITLASAKTIKAKTVKAEFVDSKLELVLVIQEFDENEIMTSLYVEDFKEDTGLVQFSYGPEVALTMQYWIGINVREDLNAIATLHFNEFDLYSRNYDLTYLANGEITETISGLHNRYLDRVASVNTIQQYLNKGSLTPAELDTVLYIYNSYGNRNYDDNSLNDLLIFDNDGNLTSWMDTYNLEEGYTLTIDLEELNEVYTLFQKIYAFHDFSNDIMTPEQELEWKQLGSELLAYQYEGNTYKFVDYDAVSDWYTFISSTEDYNNLGNLRNLISETISNGQQVITSYDILSDFQFGLDDHGYISEFAYVLKAFHVSTLARVLKDINPNILVIKNEVRAVLDYDYINTNTNIDNFVFINNGDNINDISGGTRYLEDYNYLDNNMTLFLDLFPSYYLMDRESVNVLLLSYGVLYGPLAE